ncbi:hypothetical protein NC653_004521 [Populus alba x Populus x berolinensis]|uniref:Uncharacterized protein n=1 Tax=Populus alba x Populus x berolinensis TaxID=444605 RepID=A0AAD6RWW4_9ROSI|nr:hypothetical protein NC653_004521 [Populus alba x Populus x berolinensis]
MAKPTRGSPSSRSGSGSRKHLKDVKAQLIIDKALCGGTVCPWLVDSSFILHVSSTLFSLIVTPLLIIGKVWLRLKDLLLVEGGGSPRRQLDPPCRREDSPGSRRADSVSSW